MESKVPATQKRRVVGRYELYDSIASGGMATIHLGRLLGEVGFARVVAIKRLHPHLASDPEFAAMLLDEARLAAGISHPNVVSTIDVVTADGEIFLVMDYIEGDSLSHLVRFTRKAKALVEPAIVSSVMSGALYGLHAAHIATDERGTSLNIVHRDFSPQNILIGTDGVPRVLDFGVAKAARRIAQTEAGRTKGKFSYMAPEQVRMGELDHRADIFSAGICTWEALTGRVLFGTEDPGRTIAKVIECEVPAPSTLAPGIDPSVDAIVLRALAKNPDQRFQTAREMAIALEDALAPAIPRKVGEWVSRYAADMLATRNAHLAEMVSDHHAPTTKQELRARIRTTDNLNPVVDIPDSPEAVQAPPPAPTVTPDVAPAGTPANVAPPGTPAKRPAYVAPPGIGDDDEPTQLSDSAMRQAAAQADAHAPAADDGNAATTRPREAASDPHASAGFVSSDPSAQGFAPVAADVKTPISHVSEMSVGSYAGPPRRSLPPKRSLVLIAAILGGALVATVIGLLVVIRSGSETESTAAAAPEVDTASTKPKSTAAPTQPSDEVAASPPPVPVAKLVASASAAPEASLAARGVPETSAQPPKPKPAPPVVRPPAPKLDCNPPYTMENGIKKFKRHCM